MALIGGKIGSRGVAGGLDLGQNRAVLRSARVAENGARSVGVRGGGGIGWPIRAAFNSVVRSALEVVSSAMGRNSLCKPRKRSAIMTRRSSTSLEVSEFPVMVMFAVSVRLCFVDWGIEIGN